MLEFSCPRVPNLKRAAPDVDLETAYCAEVVAFRYQAMGLLFDRHGAELV